MAEASPPERIQPASRPPRARRSPWTGRVALCAMLVGGLVPLQAWSQSPAEREATRGAREAAALGPDTRPVVAFLAPLSGAHAELGQRAQRAALMAADLWPCCRLVPFDTGPGVTAALHAARQAGAVAVLGPLGARETREAASVLDPDAPPLYTLSSEDGVEFLGPRVFRLVSSPRDQAGMIAGIEIRDRDPAGRWVVSVPDDEAGREAALGFVETAVAVGATVPHVVFHATDAVDGTAWVEALQMRRVERLAPPRDAWNQPPRTRTVTSSGTALPRPDGVYLPDYGERVANLLPFLRFAGWIQPRQGTSVQLLGSSVWNNRSLRWAGDVAAQARITLLFNALDTRTASVTFTEAWEARWRQTPTEFDAQMFDAAGFLLSALEGLPDQAAPAQVVRAVDRAPVFGGVCGRMWLSDQGGVVREMGVWEVDGGGWLIHLGQGVPPREGM